MIDDFLPAFTIGAITLYTNPKKKKKKIQSTTTVVKLPVTVLQAMEKTHHHQ